MPHIKKLLAAAALCGLHAAGSAAVVFNPVNSNTGIDNVVFNPCAAEVILGTTVSGCLNNDNSTYVTFTGSEPLSVNGGGCAGFQYKFELADTPADDDIEVTKVYEKAGAKVSALDAATVGKWRDIARDTAWKDYSGKTATCAKLMKLAADAA